MALGGKITPARLKDLRRFKNFASGKFSLGRWPTELFAFFNSSAAKMSPNVRDIIPLSMQGVIPHKPPLLPLAASSRCHGVEARLGKRLGLCQ